MITMINAVLFYLPYFKYEILTMNILNVSIITGIILLTTHFYKQHYRIKSIENLVCKIAKKLNIDLIDSRTNCDE